MLLHSLIVLVFVLGISPLFAQSPGANCDDTLDPLLSLLAEWTAGQTSAADYGFIVCATGAGLAVAHDPVSGFDVAPRQKLLWPGNLFASADSAYAPAVPRSFGEAESLLVQGAAAERRQLVYGPVPLLVTGVDTSLGAPWFFVALCDSTGPVSAIWDRADFLRSWWRWTDLPGANSIWVWPTAGPPKLGRRVVRAGMRHLVLAARPDSLGTRHFGLAALAAAQLDPDAAPGSGEVLRRMAGLRVAAANFLAGAVDLWPPAGREPIRLAAYYLQKDAEAWQTLAAVTENWRDYDTPQRAEWLASLADWETKAAVALDQIVSQSD